MGCDARIRTSRGLGLGLARPRLLVIDASQDKRLATELKLRGRAAVSLSELEIARLEDPDLLPKLFERLESWDWILITADDAMPADHAELISELQPTIATIDGAYPWPYNSDSWGREVVHRWAHYIQGRQEVRTVRRYRLNSHAVWKLRLRRRRKPVSPLL